MKIAIDGPSGSGKSTIAKQIAERLKIAYIDTGAMYRAVTYYLKTNSIPFEEIEQIKRVLPQIHITFKIVDGIQHTFLNEDDVTFAIRNPEISNSVSEISKLPEVRAYLISQQQKLAEATDCIMDGRDIASVVIPFADVKIFLDASSQIRAERRYNEQKEKGIHESFDDVHKSIVERDQKDNEVTPLVAVEGAITIDSSHATIDEVIDTILSYVH